MTASTTSTTAGQQHVTTADVINAATDVLDGITTGTLSPADVARWAVDACRELFGVVGSGPADSLWTLHGDVTRQYLAAGGLTADELTEWLAVQRRREAGSDQPPRAQIVSRIGRAEPRSAAGQRTIGRCCRLCDHLIDYNEVCMKPGMLQLR